MDFGLQSGGLDALITKKIKPVVEVNTFNPEPFEEPMDEIMAPKETKRKQNLPPQSADTKFDFDTVDDEVAKKVEESDFWTFCAEYIPKQKTCTNVITPEQILSYSKTLSRTITHLPYELTDLAHKNFKRITFMITEQLTKGQLIDQTKKMIKTGLKNPDDLKDEMYFQMIKQIRSNTDQQSQYQCWTLLACVSCYFAPSYQAVYPILNYQKFIALNHPDDEIQIWAKFSFSRILKIFVEGPRGVLPSTYELEFLRDHRKIPFTVYLFSGGYHEFYVENHMTLGEVKDLLIEKLGLDASKRFLYGFMETTVRADRIEECYIEDFVKCSDVISSWEHESMFYRELQDYGAEYTSEFKVNFKMRYPVDIEKDSKPYLNMRYNESSYLFNNLHFNCTVDDLLELFTLQLQINMGDCDQGKKEYVRENMFSNVPNYESKYLKSEEDFVDDIEASYENHTGKKRNEAKKAFNEIIEKYDMFGYNFFVVKVQEQSNCEMTYPNRVIIGIRMDGIAIFDLSWNKIKDITFGDAFKWGYSESTCVILYGEEESPSKLTFKTYQGTAIVNSITSFVNGILGKNPKPNKLANTAMKTAQNDKVFFKRVSVYIQAEPKIVIS